MGLRVQQNHFFCTFWDMGFTKPRVPARTFFEVFLLNKVPKKGRQRLTLKSTKDVQLLIHLFVFFKTGFCIRSVLFEVLKESVKLQITKTKVFFRKRGKLEIFRGHDVSKTVPFWRNILFFSIFVNRKFENWAWKRFEKKLLKDSFPLLWAT